MADFISFREERRNKKKYCVRFPYTHIVDWQQPSRAQQLDIRFVHRAYKNIEIQRWMCDTRE